MSTPDKMPKPNVCPCCGGRMTVPEFLAGMWSGAKTNGMPAGGGVFEDVCGGCGAALEVFNDVYDDFGNVLLVAASVEPKLFWREKSS